MHDHDIGIGYLLERLQAEIRPASPLLNHLVAALLMVRVPSSLGAVIFFTLAPIGVAVPIVSTIITAVALEAHRGAVLGIVVAVSTLPGIIAPLMTGLIIQAAGKNVAVGFQHAYLLASLILLMVGGAFLAGIVLLHQ